MAKAAHWLDTDAEVRKRGEQTGLDTLVVHTVNDECQSSGSILFGDTPNGLSIPPGEYGRKIKTKELTGARTSGGACGLIRRYAQNLTNP